MRVLLSLVVAAVLFVSHSATAGTLERVRQTSTFKIGYRTDAPPFSYKNDIGEPAGYIVDLCREVAASVKQELGLKDLKVEYVTVTADDRFDAVASGRVDLLCEATTVTLARRKLVDFSLMTFVDGASVMVRSDGPQSFKALAGHKIGVHAGTTTEQELRRTLADLKVQAEMVPVADHEEGVKRLESGEFAAYFADRAILTYLLLGEGAPKTLRISKEYFSREPYALALARDDGDFRLLVDRTLARLYRSSAIGSIFARSFGKAKASDILQTLYAINALPE
ncbi:MAG TPA: amino acid ABC transporter substrate-binding protein [Candidatus Acidoferrum sp.]|nr:amino acid ABC transporter substrate-binding protein [Candidatus Acidoferrum sp.]